MKVPPKRKGNGFQDEPPGAPYGASMKVPPKRKGNIGVASTLGLSICLNESPSEKEGKSHTHFESA